VPKKIKKDKDKIKEKKSSKEKKAWVLVQVRVIKICGLHANAFKNIRRQIAA